MKKLKFILLSTLIYTSNSIFSQVVINEVMARPSGSQGLIVHNGNSGNEYIELYNPSCSAIDVSGYYIGMRQDFSGASGGAFRIPSVAAAVIPPNGHLVLGTSTSSADPNSVDIKLPDYTSNYCQNTATLNLLLANADGWLGLYDAAGTPIDALYWSSAAANISQGADYGGVPCVPAGSPAGVALESAQQINSSFPGVLSYVGNTPSTGLTFSRMPDGGAWVRDVAASINDLNVGNCNGGNCQSAASFNISASVTQPSCSNDDGAITINTIPAAGAYTYTWTPNVSTTSSANGLPAGTYDIIVDLNGCQKDTSITLTSGTGPSAIVVNTVNPACGQTDGSISLGAVTGGTGPYTYNLNGAGFSGNQNYNNLGANTYTLVVQDNNGCTYNAPNVILTSTTGITAINVSTTDPTCGQANGVVDLGSVTGGTGPYTYNFNNAGFLGQINYPNLAAGNYTLLVQDNNGCTFTAPNVILSNGNGPTAIAVTTTDPSCGASDGVIVLGTVTGGVGPYQYNLDGNGLSANQNYNNMGAGSYTLVVEDVNGCSFTAPNVVLNNGNGPSAITVTTTNPACGQNNGTITLGAVTGGTGPYTYNLNGAGFNPQLSYVNLAAGNFSLIVQDNGGCTFNAPNITLTDIPGPTAISSTITQPTCGFSNGTIQIGTTTGGTGPYQYNFNSQGFVTTAIYNNLNPGSYTLIVRDNNGCTFTAQNLILNNSSAVTNIAITATNTTCGQSNGNLSLGAVTGGTMPYQYNINNQGFSSTLNYSNLSSGAYTIIVRDNTGCTFNTVANIASSDSPNNAQIVVTNASCGNINGIIDISNITGGTAPYQVSINGSALSTNLNYPSLAGGNYAITIEDVNGCQYSTSAIINSSSNPNANFILNPVQINMSEPFTNATNISSSDVTNYFWTSNSSIPSSSVEENPSFDFTSQGPGFYPITLIVENSDGCRDSITNYIEILEDVLIFVPNTFTPDGNELNNTWNIIASGIDIMEFNVLIFNRWGEIVWESKDVSVGWDGTYMNRKVKSDIYTWKLTVKDKKRTESLNLNGFVNVQY